LSPKYGGVNPLTIGASKVNLEGETWNSKGGKEREAPTGLSLKPGGFGEVQGKKSRTNKGEGNLLFKPICLAFFMGKLIKRNGGAEPGRVGGPET